jgi:hypothetical protein
MTAVEIQIYQVWSNEQETQVFARVHDEKGSCLTLRISRNNALFLSSESRAVACFHDLPVATFEKRAAIRRAPKSAAREAWRNCVQAARSPDAIVEFYDSKEEHVD